MKRVVPEYAHQCSNGHWSWSRRSPLPRCPHMVAGKPCAGLLEVKGKKQVTVEE